jgi:hypothetical protein
MTGVSATIVSRRLSRAYDEAGHGRPLSLRKTALSMCAVDPADPSTCSTSRAA